MPNHSGHAFANMADVARDAGVSVATVSRALRRLPGVGESTRRKIMESAERLNYVISPEASALAGGATRRVALLVSRLDLWFYSAMVSGLESELRAGGHDVLLYQVNGETERQQFFADLPTRRKADALVVIALPLREDQAERLSVLGVTVVIAGGRVGAYPHVRIDDEAIGRRAVEHLLGLGHTKIAMVRTVDPEGTIWDTDTGRVNGYLQALRAAGVEAPDEYVVTIPFGIQGGSVAMERLLDLPDPPTAVFAHSDNVAVGALRTLRRRGLRVPDDMSIIGVDDQPIAELSDLTTVRQSPLEQGHLAGRMLLSLLANEQPDEAHVVLPTELVVRGTTAPPSSN